MQGDILCIELTVAVEIRRIEEVDLAGNVRTLDQCEIACIDALVTVQMKSGVEEPAGTLSFHHSRLKR